MHFHIDLKFGKGQNGVIIKCDQGTVFNHHRLNYYFVYIFKTRTDNKDKVKSFKK